MNTATAPQPDAALNADVDAHADAVLAPEPITLGGHHFRVAPMKVRQVFPFLKLARPLFAALASRPSSPPPGPSTGADAGPGQGGVLPSAGLTAAELEASLADADFILDVLENHGPSVVKALAVGVCSDLAKVPQTEEAVGDLDLGDVVTLLKHFVVVNASFFAQRGLSLPQGFSLTASAGASPPSSS